MAVKVMMKRVPKSGVWREMNVVLREMRIMVMSQPGYISGETLLSSTGQGTTLVVSVWDTVSHWREYEGSAKRRVLLAKMEPLLAETHTTEVWVESPVIG